MESSDLGFIHHYVPPAGMTLRTLLLLHGTGGDKNDLLGLGRALNPAAALLSPRGKVVERGMPRFFRRFGEGVFDLDDLRFPPANWPTSFPPRPPHTISTRAR